MPGYFLLLFEPLTWLTGSKVGFGLGKMEMGLGLKLDWIERVMVGFGGLGFSSFGSLVFRD